MSCLKDQSLVHTREPCHTSPHWHSLPPRREACPLDEHGCIPHELWPHTGPLTSLEPFTSSVKWSPNTCSGDLTEMPEAHWHSMWASAFCPVESCANAMRHHQHGAVERLARTANDDCTPQGLTEPSAIAHKSLVCSWRCPSSIGPTGSTALYIANT